MVKDDIIQFKGIDELNAEEKRILNKLSTEYFGRIKRNLRSIAAMNVHIKTHHNTGDRKRKKYSFDIKVVTPSRVPFVSNKSADWDIARGLHKAFNDIMLQTKRKLKLTSGRKYNKPYERFM